MKLNGRIARENLESIGQERPHPAVHGVPRIWLVAADDHVARIFRKSGDLIEPLGEILPEDIHKNATNKTTGRVVSSGDASIRHKYEPHMQARYENDAHFSRQLAEWLDEAVGKNAFDRLIMAAAPHTLGLLRQFLSRRTHERIAASISKDLTKHDAEALREDLTKILWF
jgi:protein required for attachment to host cells